MKFLIVALLAFVAGRAHAATTFGFIRCDGVTGVSLKQEVSSPRAYFNSDADFAKSVQLTEARNLLIRQLAAQEPISSFVNEFLVDAKTLQVVDPASSSGQLSLNYELTSTSGRVLRGETVSQGELVITPRGQAEIYGQFVLNELIGDEFHNDHLLIESSALGDGEVLVSSSALEPEIGTTQGVLRALDIDRSALRSSSNGRQSVQSSLSAVIQDPAQGGLTSIRIVNFTCTHGVAGNLKLNF